MYIGLLPVVTNYSNSDISHLHSLVMIAFIPILNAITSPVIVSVR